MESSDFSDLQCHYFSSEISLEFPHIDSVAYWARNPNNTLILFVHGFNGHAVMTWQGFSSYLLFHPSTLEKHAALQGADVIFYGYESRTKQVWTNADRLYDLLEILGTSPCELVNTSLDAIEVEQRGEFQYKRIIIVAHSLGGLLTRKAFLFAHKNKADWIQKFEMLLFAPAHLGAHLPELIQETCLPLLPLNMIFSVYKLYAQAIVDLDCKSDRIKELRSQTVERVSMKSSDWLMAKLIVHAADDRVVIQEEFLEGEPYERLDEIGHSKICKPTRSFMAPLELLLRIVG